MEKKKGRRRETTTRRESVLTVSNLKDEKFKNNKLFKKIILISFLVKYSGVSN